MFLGPVSLFMWMVIFKNIGGVILGWLVMCKFSNFPHDHPVKKPQENNPKPLFHE